MEWSCKSLKDPSLGRTNMGSWGRMNILCAMCIQPLCSFCPEIYWCAANSFIVQNKWSKYLMLVSGWVCSHFSLLCSSEAIFLHINVSVQSAPAVFILPRLPIYDKMVIVFQHPCKKNFGGWGCQTYPSISKNFISFALEMWWSTVYIGKCKIGSFCPGLPYKMFFLGIYLIDITVSRVEQTL